MTNSVRTVTMGAMAMAAMGVVVWVGASLLNKLDLVAELAVELRREHNRLCTMYSMFGPLKEEGIKPELFPLCRSTYEAMTNHTRREKE